MEGHVEKDAVFSIRGGRAIIGVALLIAAVYAVLTYFVPAAGDDYMYLHRWKEWTGSEDFSLRSYIRFIKLNRVYDNFRLGNMCVPFAVLFSPTKEIFPVLNGLMMAATIWLGSLVAYRGPSVARRVFYMGTIWFLMIVCVPWGWMFATDFALNYIWSSAISLLFIVMLLSLKKKPRPLYFLLCLLCAFLAGGWHEGFALPTLCGILLYIMLKRNMGMAFYVCFGVFFCSTLFFLWSPGILNRASETLGVVRFPTSVWLYLGLIIFLTVCTLACCFRRSRRAFREKVSSPYFIVGTVIIVAGYVMGILTDNNPRCYFWAIEMSIFLTVFVFRDFKYIRKRKCLVWGSLFLYGVCLLQSFMVIDLQVKFNREHNRILSLIERSRTGFIYHDMESNPVLPWWAFKMPLCYQWYTPWHYYLMKVYLGLPGLSIAPKAFEGDSLSVREPLAKSSGFFMVDGLLVSDKSAWKGRHGVPTLPEMISLYVRSKNGTAGKVTAFVSPFVSKIADVSGKNNALVQDTFLYYQLFPEIPVASVDSIDYSEMFLFP